MVLLDELEFPFYPSPPYENKQKLRNDTEPYSLKLVHMMEFIELSKIIKDEDRPSYIAEKFNLDFLHQEMIRRIMLNNDSILIIHPPGKGKTCTAVGISEHISAYGTNVNKRPNFPKRTYILERGPSVIGDVKNQIITVCAKEKYKLEALNLSSKGEKRRITNMLIGKGNYTIQTYKDFSSLSLSDQLIKKIYSDSIFIIDEAHNLNTWGEDSPEDDEEGGKDEIMNKKDIIATYKYLHRVLHIAERIKIIIMTATPMSNGANELTKLLNLILPMDKQIDPNINIVDMPTDKFNWYTEGLVSYLPDTTGKIEVEEIGERIDGSNTVITMLPMKGTQALSYEKLNKLGEKPGAFYTNYRKISGFVFPDGSYGGKGNKISQGLYKYIEKPDSDTFIPKPQFAEDLRKNLFNYSAIFNYVIKKELNPNRKIELPGGYSVSLPGKGCSYYFFDLVVAHAIPFTMALEAHGFERYNDDVNPFHTFAGKTTITLSKKPRYIFVTGANVATKLENFKNIFNSKKNVFGEYVQIFVGSKIIKDGINLYNVNRLYINPSWNNASMIQAMSRAKRLPGHDLVIEATKDIMRKKKIPEEIINGWKFKLEQHKMSAYLPGKSDITDIKTSANNYFYAEIIEKKNRDIDATMKRLINISIDKYLNGIEKVPFNLESENINYNNFNMLYSQNVVNTIRDIIVSSLGKKTYIYSINEIFDVVYPKLSPFLRNREYVINALNDIISERSVIYDDYGNRTWMHYAGKYIFISTMYPDNVSTSDIQNLFYKNSIIVQHDNIQKYVRRYCEENVNIMIDIPFAQNTPISNSVVAEYLIKEEFKRRPEEAIEQQWWNPDNNKLHTLLSRLLRSVVVATILPYFDIKNLSQKLSLMVGPTGLRVSETKKVNIKDFVFSPESTSKNIQVDGKDIELPLVIVHNIDEHGLRIFNTNTLMWEYATNYEEAVYLNIYSIRRFEKLAGLRENEIYGTLEMNGDFFVSRVPSKSSMTGVSTDKRLMLRGTACNNYHKNEIMKLLKEEGIIIGGDLSKRDLCAKLKDILKDKSKLIIN